MNIKYLTPKTYIFSVSFFQISMQTGKTAQKMGFNKPEPAQLELPKEKSDDLPF